MNRRKATLALLATAAAALPFGARSQPGAVKRRVAVVAVGSLASQPLASLVEGLRELGYVEGQNIEFDRPLANAEFSRLAEMSARAVERRPEVIVAFGTTATASARKATQQIPIVTVMGSDPVQLGFVTNLARPEGNLTGLAMETQALAGKRVELLKEIVPEMRRLAVLWNPAGSAQPANLRLVEKAASRLGVGVQVIEVRSAADLAGAAAALSKSRPDALLVIPSSLFGALRDRLVQLAVAYRLPSVLSADAVRAGGLASYSPDPKAQFRRAAYFVDRILKGAKPGELPIEQPTKFELVLNLKTAKALGITIPHSVLVRADEVIQ
jgi:putative ABC transport system substrate-binding protein